LGQRFEDLFLPYVEAAYRLARFIVRDPIAADDIVQESFLRALRFFGSYRGGDAKSWLLTIVRNCSFDWSKSNRRIVGITSDAATADMAVTYEITVGDSFRDSLGRWIPSPDSLGTDQDGPETTLLRQSEIAEVRAMIDRLPEPFRETLVLRELEELSYKQIAQVTSVPLGTVMSRLARARHLLICQMERRQ
jgi:RNA polymerase sigma factor (sigma-70 family)